MELEEIDSQVLQYYTAIQKNNYYSCNVIPRTVNDELIFVNVTHSFDIGKER